MKKIFTHLQLGLIGLVAILASSCQHEKLSEVIVPQSFTPVSASLVTKTEVGAGSNFTLTGADLTVPATINFSGPTSSAFTINLSTNIDTVASLITAGTLPAGTVAFSSGSAAVLPQINVPAGVTSVSFNIVVSRSSMELAYGKNLAAAIKISAPTKGNTIASGKSAMIFVVKTTDVLTAASIHEISFGSATKVYDVSANPSSYVTGSLSLTVSIPVVLQGDPGAEFTVDVVSSPDSVTKYINAGTLPNAALYPDANFSIGTPTVKILAGTNSALVTFTTKIATLLALQPSPGAPTVNLPTIALTLKNPSKYQISKTKVTTLFVTLNPNTFRPYYGTPFLVKGDIGAVSDPIYGAYYDFGGEGIAYHDDNNKDGDGSWRAPDYVDTNPDYTPRSVIGWTSNNEWLTYSIFVQQAGTYQMNTMLGSPGDGNTYSVYIDNVLINSKLPVKNTTDYRNQQPNYSTINLPAGYHILKLFWNQAQYDFRSVTFTRTN
ncbi:carbohydrate-binding protein [Mucilaginibacter sp. UR6-11]|uniref:carbohydrate-binding protein n=1 Tax=Mucilaginibacter sp. UR6-11 TaxID=1435644 RepID=UPI001E570D7B|nr:carbohydrate-binding protein [Mucilaginibacter sp. UR6-11]MCC8424887.1 hypothetical protein [Mucilaginibacter sp. UR6-11]